MASTPLPTVETPTHQPQGEYVSSGRGGAGNMVPNRSKSRDRHEEKEKEKHGFSGLLHKVTHPGQKDKE